MRVKSLDCSAECVEQIFNVKGENRWIRKREN